MGFLKNLSNSLAKKQAELEKSKIIKEAKSNETKADLQKAKTEFKNSIGQLKGEAIKVKEQLYQTNQNRAKEKSTIKEQKKQERLEKKTAIKQQHKEEMDRIREQYTFKAMAERERQKLEDKKADKQYQKDRITQLKKEHVPFCPKCHSTNLTYIAKRKKLSFGRAVVGGAIGSLAGPLGTAAGATMGGLSSNKLKKGTVKCLNCGHTWKL